MKKIIQTFLVIVLGVTSSSCMSLNDGTTPNRQAFMYLQLGMTREEVRAFIGTKPVIVLSEPSPAVVARTDENRKDGALVSQRHYTTVENPYVTEKRIKEGTLYIIDYYVTAHINAGTEFYNEDLTPVVYKGERLIGWGWEFLHEIFPQKA